MNNDIIVRTPEKLREHSPLRHIIVEQLKIFSYGETNPRRHEVLVQMICDYYNERARNADMSEYELITGEAAEADPMASIKGNPAAYEYVCAVEDARWAGTAAPAWHDRECVRHNGNYYGRELPGYGLVSLAYHTAYGNANICCPYIFKVRSGAYGDPEYFDFEERACFYGNYYKHPDDSPEFGFWYTDNEALIRQMHEFIDNLAECYLDTDSMICYPR